MRFRILRARREFTDPMLVMTAELWRLDPALGPVLVQQFSTPALDARTNDRVTVYRAVRGAAMELARKHLEELEGARRTEDALEGVEFEL